MFRVRSDNLDSEQYLAFLQQVDRAFVFRAHGHPDVRGQVELSFWADKSSGLREILLVVPRDEYAKLAKEVNYTLHPLNAVGGYQWKVKDGVTIRREASLEEKLDGLIQRVDKRDGSAAVEKVAEQVKVLAIEGTKTGETLSRLP